MKNRTWKQFLKSFIPKPYEVIVSAPIFIIALLITELLDLDNKSIWLVAGLFIFSGIIAQVGIHAMEGILLKEYDKGYDNGYADGEHDTQNLSEDK